ncbi:hypothetical protein AAFF_G00167690 [Aldrovandia affinis]|uniref:Uncharacterized protein n=1 Tax=Aldrovandia affinis TaxID=143900 RepID=A0AAD7W7W9_9TELE|nr:hypothetical protein AAFF_G00167690 [Aldrovandia affinis]
MGPQPAGSLGKQSRRPSNGPGRSAPPAEGDVTPPNCPRVPGGGPALNSGSLRSQKRRQERRYRSAFPKNNAPGDCLAVPADQRHADIYSEGKPPPPPELFLLLLPQNHSIWD